MRKFNNFTEIENYVDTITLIDKKADELVEILSHQPEFIPDLAAHEDLRHIFSGSNIEKFGRYLGTTLLVFPVLMGAVPYEDNPRRLHFHQSPSRSKILIENLYTQLSNNQGEARNICKGILILSNFDGCDDFILIQKAMNMVLDKININQESDFLVDQLFNLKNKFLKQGLSFEKLEDQLEEILSSNSRLAI